MKRIAILAAGLLMLGSSPASAQERERVTAAAGISIEVPAGWTVLPPDPPVAILRGTSYATPEFEKAVEAIEASFITLTKAPADSGGIAPVIRVRLRVVDYTRLPVQMLAQQIEAKRRAFPRLEVLDPPQWANFAGALGAYVREAHMLPRSAKERQAISETWIAVRGIYAIVLEAEYDGDEPVPTVMEIERAAKSLWIDASGPPPMHYGP